jgi:hypothetical protein
MRLPKQVNPVVRKAGAVGISREKAGIQPMADCQCSQGVCVDIDCAQSRCVSLGEKIKCAAKCGTDGTCWYNCLSSSTKQCIQDHCLCQP